MLPVQYVITNDLVIRIQPWSNKPNRPAAKLEVYTKDTNPLIGIELPQNGEIRFRDISIISTSYTIYVVSTNTDQIIASYTYNSQQWEQVAAIEGITAHTIETKIQTGMFMSPLVLYNKQEIIRIQPYQVSSMTSSILIDTINLSEPTVSQKILNTGTLKIGDITIELTSAGCMIAERLRQKRDRFNNVSFSYTQGWTKHKNPTDNSAFHHNLVQISPRKWVVPRASLGPIINLNQVHQGLTGLLRPQIQYLPDGTVHQITLDYNYNPLGLLSLSLPVAGGYIEADITTNNTIQIIRLDNDNCQVGPPLATHNPSQKTWLVSD